MSVIPKWIKKLPEWAIYNSKTGFVEVDPDVVYPKFLIFIEEHDKECAAQKVATNPTQYALELARTVFTRALKKIMYDNGPVCRANGTGRGEKLFLRILAKDKKWALKNYPVGKPLSKAGIYRKLGWDKPLGNPIKIPI